MVSARLDITDRYSTTWPFSNSRGFRCSGLLFGTYCRQTRADFRLLDVSAGLPSKCFAVRWLWYPDYESAPRAAQLACLCTELLCLLYIVKLPANLCIIASGCTLSVDVFLFRFFTISSGDRTIVAPYFFAPARGADRQNGTRFKTAIYSVTVGIFYV